MPEVERLSAFFARNGSGVIVSFLKVMKQNVVFGEAFGTERTFEKFDWSIILFCSCQAGFSNIDVWVDFCFVFQISMPAKTTKIWMICIYDSGLFRKRNGYLLTNVAWQISHSRSFAWSICRWTSRSSCRRKQEAHRLQLINSSGWFFVQCWRNWFLKLNVSPHLSHGNCRVWSWAFCSWRNKRLSLVNPLGQNEHLNSLTEPSYFSFFFIRGTTLWTCLMCVEYASFFSKDLKHLSHV